MIIKNQSFFNVLFALLSLCYAFFVGVYRTKTPSMTIHTPRFVTSVTTWSPGVVNEIVKYKNSELKNFLQQTDAKESVHTVDAGSERVCMILQLREDNYVKVETTRITISNLHAAHKVLERPEWFAQKKH